MHSPARKSRHGKGKSDGSGFCPAFSSRRLAYARMFVPLPPLLSITGKYVNCCITANKLFA